VSVSDPEARVMRLADGATAPAWNVQVATSNGFILAIDPTDRRNDSGLSPGLVENVALCRGRVPQRLLADNTAMTGWSCGLAFLSTAKRSVNSEPLSVRMVWTVSGKRSRKRARKSAAVTARRSGRISR
jgi:hypothetical protein